MLGASNVAIPPVGKVIAPDLTPRRSALLPSVPTWIMKFRDAVKNFAAPAR